MGSVKRTTLRQYLLYLGLNVVVSALTVLLVLNLFGGGGRQSEETPTPTIDLLAQVASSFPTDTATLAPSPTPLTYQVQPGDTLGDIATRLGVPLQDLMEANDIEDPNALDVGQVLIIPVSSSPLAGGGDSDGGEGELESTATPEQESNDAGVIISAVYDAGDLQNESIRLFNTGGIVRMEGWTIEDGEGRIFTFPDFTFYSTGAVNLHTRSGVDTSIDLFWGLDEAIWEPGKVVTLKNADGDVVSTFPIPDA
jgi:LysM repeat protein